MPAHLKFSGQTILCTDAGNVYDASVLSQKVLDDTVRLFQTLSRAQHDKKNRVSTIWKECLAIACFKTPLRPYSGRNRFTIRTDRDPLNYSLNLCSSTNRRARCRLCIAEFGFDNVHGAGVEQHWAEALSRLTIVGADISSLGDAPFCLV